MEKEPSRLDQPQQPPASNSLENIARNLNPSSENFTEQCMQIGVGAPDVRALLTLFSIMPVHNEAATLCGHTFASKSLQSFDNDDLIVYKAIGEEKSVVNVLSDYTCSFCARFHNRIPELNSNGVTVRIFPYGRADYKVNGQPTAIAQNMATAMCGSSEQEKAQIFNDLISNQSLYAQKVYSQNEIADNCIQKAMTYKLFGDIFSRQRQTPLIFHPDGFVQIGDALT
ncbi:hypothetical protein ERJ77_23855, partial [Vibrio anguillarum]|nr:hypothetical protein [Vibrio anguillarum]